MDTKKLTAGDRFYHPLLNNLIMCRDEHFNQCYGQKETDEAGKMPKKYFTINEDEEEGPHVYENYWKEFEVVWAQYGGGGTGHGPHDVYPDAWQVICRPVSRKNFYIKFNQETNCYHHTIEEVQAI